MKQYLDLLKDIKEKGVVKGAARENMPHTKSLFGYQMRFNLQEGFPILTTKRLSFKNIANELIWFLRGQSNIKFMVDRGCYIWEQDAYNYYVKLASKNTDESWNNIYQRVNTKTNKRGVPKGEEDSYSMFTFEEFQEILRNTTLDQLFKYQSNDYILGDTGVQYPILWRDWVYSMEVNGDFGVKTCYVDQIHELFLGLLKNPLGRRHIITAWRPDTLDDMALNSCHVFVQFNCRPLTYHQRNEWALKNVDKFIKENKGEYKVEIAEPFLDDYNVPKYYLDCQLYQRSADTFLGVPYNIASYALLTEIVAKFVGMIPSEFVHTFGDVHIYSNHEDQVKEQLTREPRELSILQFSDEFETIVENISLKYIEIEDKVKGFLESINQWEVDLFSLKNYNPHPSIEAPLSTGMVK